jgi:hypothetical protein
MADASVWQPISWLFFQRCAMITLTEETSTVSPIWRSIQHEMARCEHLDGWSRHFD